MLIKHRKKTDSGFTLIEVLIVIVIIGLIAAIGTPSFNNWRQNANVSADMRRLYGFFQKARIEAVKQNKTCSIVLT
ncbi:MAG: prepilin-type N-terminal cleavage/methylation domain-containing protein, partial [Desulfuromonadales bacterium]|nr:prepilin-type N-terminal cleavage/methylation domain-containing protein [Desulfuromonadales bacterium]